MPVPLTQGDGMMSPDGFHPGPPAHRHRGQTLAQAASPGMAAHDCELNA